MVLNPHNFGHENNVVTRLHKSSSSVTPLLLDALARALIGIGGGGGGGECSPYW